MKTLLLGVIFGVIGGVLAFGLAIIEGIGGAFGAAAGSISPSSYLFWGIVPVVATACLSRFIGRKEAIIAAAIVLGVVLWRCWSGYGDYLKEGGVWAKSAPQWLALMKPISILAATASAVAIAALPKKKHEERAA